MAAFAEGKVVTILEERPGLVRVTVSLGDRDIQAVGFPAMLPPLRVGDRVVVNTTGLELELGTGGVGFILWNLDGGPAPAPGPGHIVKVRYTPWQTEVLAAEAPESPHHDALKDVRSIDGMPVVACSLHSQVAAAAAGIKAEGPSARVGYLMTDGAALPLAWSDLVATLKEAGLVDITCTAGHAFGGDLEAVNVFSALTALRIAGECDAVVAAMGPGIVGTASALGFTGLEQGQVLDAAGALDGRAIAALRINFADTRPRQQGVSHHCLTALTIAAQRPCTVVVPELPGPQAVEVADRLAEYRIAERHDLVEAKGGPGLELLRERGIKVTSMGRSLEDVPELFLAAAAAGSVARATNEGASKA
jgi:hypothetical protein